MKTKIIYISGAEVFDMAEIRGAFDEVRATLGLNNDTVLFGVPVDNDDALADVKPVKVAQADVAAKMPDADKSIVEPVADLVAEPIIEDIIPEKVPESEIPAVNSPVAEVVIEEKPKKSARKPRARAKAAKTPDADESIVEPVADVVIPQEPAPVIPILSVLASKLVAEAPADTAEAEISDNDITAEEIIQNADIIDETSVATPAEAEQSPVAVVEDINIDAELTTATDVAGDDNSSTQRVTIGDMINDDIPTEPIEKTLEQLLESMKPLREDHIEAEEASDAEPVADIAAETFADANETDATLERLATEFAETQDKIVATPRAENHGKIGKLKNILPFKKVKRDDTGLMGDLFGWAGIAANDEEFSIPGFFTNAASKK